MSDVRLFLFYFTVENNNNIDDVFGVYIDAVIFSALIILFLMVICKKKKLSWCLVAFLLISATHAGIPSVVAVVRNGIRQVWIYVILNVFI